MSGDTNQRTRSERLMSVNETKLKLIENNIESDPASKILWAILDKYVETGIPVETSLFLKHRYDNERKFVVKLYNDKKRKDTVFIRVLDPDEKNSRHVNPNISNTSNKRPVGIYRS